MAASKPKAVVKQDSQGRWYFVLVGATNSGILYEGHHHLPPHAKGRALEDRDRLIGAASRAEYSTEDRD